MNTGIATYIVCQFLRRQTRTLRRWRSPILTITRYVQCARVTFLLRKRSPQRDTTTTTSNSVRIKYVLIFLLWNLYDIAISLFTMPARLVDLCFKIFLFLFFPQNNIINLKRGKNPRSRQTDFNNIFSHHITSIRLSRKEEIIFLIKSFIII